MFGPEPILTATQPKEGPRGVAPKNFLNHALLFFGNAFFSRDCTEAGGGLRGLCFSPFFSVFLEKEFITVFNHGKFNLVHFRCTALWIRNAEEGMQAYKQAGHCRVTATPNIILEKKLLR